MPRHPHRMVIPVVLVVLSACGSATLTLSRTSVATGAEDALEKLVGSRPDVTCPKDLDAKVGARTRCTLTAGSDPRKYGVTVTVTSVEGTHAKFDVQVDKQPQN